MPQAVYTRKDVAVRYGFSLSTVDEWIAASRIGYLKINRAIRFTEEHLRQFEKDHNIKSVGED